MNRLRVGEASRATLSLAVFFSPLPHRGAYSEANVKMTYEPSLASNPEDAVQCNLFNAPPTKGSTNRGLGINELFRNKKTQFNQLFYGHITNISRTSEYCECFTRVCSNNNFSLPSQIYRWRYLFGDKFDVLSPVYYRSSRRRRDRKPISIWKGQTEKSWNLLSSWSLYFKIGNIMHAE